MGTLGLVPTPQTSQTVQKALGAQTMACSASPSSDFLKHKFSILSSFMSKIAPVALFTTSEADSYRQDVE